MSDVDYIGQVPFIVRSDTFSDLEPDIVRVVGDMDPATSLVVFDASAMHLRYHVGVGTLVANPDAMFVYTTVVNQGITPMFLSWAADTPVNEASERAKLETVGVLGSSILVLRDNAAFPTIKKKPGWSLAAATFSQGRCSSIETELGKSRTMMVTRYWMDALPCNAEGVEIPPSFESAVFCNPGGMWSVKLK